MMQPHAKGMLSIHLKLFVYFCQCRARRNFVIKILFVWAQAHDSQSCRRWPRLIVVLGLKIFPRELAVFDSGRLVNKAYRSSSGLAGKVSMYSCISIDHPRFVLILSPSKFMNSLVYIIYNVFTHATSGKIMQWKTMLSFSNETNQFGFIILPICFLSHQYSLCQNCCGVVHTGILPNCSSKTPVIDVSDGRIEP